MNTIKLNGANPEKVAELIGGTLLLVDITADEAMIAGGDISKLQTNSCNSMQAVEA